MKNLPKGWDYDRLKDVADINTHSLPANTDPDYEFDYLEISNVDYYGIIDPTTIEHLRFEDAPSRARRQVKKENVLISSVRPNLQAAAFIQNTFENLICSTGFNVVEPYKAKLFPKFAYYVLISEDARQYFEATAIGVGYPAVSDKHFSSFVVPLPPLPEQERIAAYLDAALDNLGRLTLAIPQVAEDKFHPGFVKKGEKFHRLFEAIEKQITILVAWRKSLIHECVTGLRRVTEAEVKVAERFG